MYDRDFWNEAYEQYPDSVEIDDQLLDSEIAGLTVGSALDLGCGMGTNALKLAAAGWTVTGVDIADKAVALAQQHAQRRDLAATFIAADATTWQPPQTYALVISLFALPNRDAGAKILQTAAQALAPGGTLLVAEWDRSMAAGWGFDEADMFAPADIAGRLGGLHIEQMEVRQLPNAFPADDPRAANGSTAARVSFVRARKGKSGLRTED